MHPDMLKDRRINKHRGLIEPYGKVGYLDPKEALNKRIENGKSKYYRSLVFIRMDFWDNHRFYSDTLGNDTYLKPKLIELQCAEYNQTSGEFELRNLLKENK